MTQESGAAAKAVSILSLDITPAKVALEELGVSLVSCGDDGNKTLRPITDVLNDLSKI